MHGMHDMRAHRGVQKGRLASGHRIARSHSSPMRPFGLCPGAGGCLHVAAGAAALAAAATHTYLPRRVLLCLTGPALAADLTEPCAVALAAC